jgi:hypothetical protein
VPVRSREHINAQSRKSHRFYSWCNMHPCADPSAKSCRATYGVTLVYFETPNPPQNTRLLAFYPPSPGTHTRFILNHPLPTPRSTMPSCFTTDSDDTTRARSTTKLISGGRRAAYAVTGMPRFAPKSGGRSLPTMLKKGCANLWKRIRGEKKTSGMRRPSGQITPVN